MNKILLSLILLILLTINANSETNVVKVSNFDVPANEQWMVDRVLAENPDLKAADLSRVEFVAGTYYGQVNSSGVPNGHGILGTVDEEGSIDKGIESNFKNGKIGENEEPTIVSSTGETQTGAVAVEFQNRAFNNGFDVRVGLSNTLLDALTNPDYISNTIETLEFLKKQKSTYDYNPFIIRELQTLQDLYQVENIDLELISNLIEKLKKTISEKISSTERSIFHDEKRIEEQEKQKKERLEELGAVFSQEPKNLGEIFVFLMSDAMNIDIGDDDEYELKMDKWRLDDRKDDLIGLKDVQLKVNDLLNFGFLLNEPTDNDDELVSILLGIGQTDLKLDDIRFNVNINLRKDTTGGAIEGKINGKWYEIETEMVVGIDGTQIKLSLTKKGKSDLAAAEAAAQGSDSSSSSGSSEGGS